VASFLHGIKVKRFFIGFKVLISFREWLHSYFFIGFKEDSGSKGVFSSLSESGFIPTGSGDILPQIPTKLVLISFREWLHSY